MARKVSFHGHGAKLFFFLVRRQPNVPVSGVRAPHGP